MSVKRLARRPIVRLDGAARLEQDDRLTLEEPLEIRLHGEAIAVVMRTPKDDFDLVAGFLLTEGIVRQPADLGLISYCEQAQPPNLKNVIEARLADGVEFDTQRLKRNFYASSSCGICGKASIDHIIAQAQAIDTDFTVSTDFLYALDGKLRQAQEVFAQTGSIHAAGLFDTEGQLLSLREDVGRHNAVDKVIGKLVREGRRPPEKCVLMVSGRTSFEIMQKALVAGIPMVAAVSGPSSLAVDFAREANMTLVGFLRGKRCNVYAGAERIESPDEKQPHSTEEGDSNGEK